MRVIPILLLLLMADCSPTIPTAPSSLPSNPPVTPPVTSAPFLKPRLKPVAGDQPGPMFDETVNWRARAANLASLKPKRLGDNDLELRVWVGFGKKPLEGFIITRTAGNWDGTFLESINPTTKPPYRRSLTPAIPWDEVWRKLVDAGLYTLPDSSQLKDEKLIEDGTGYAVEIKQGNTYRTYSYLNPDFQTWPEAKQMLRIAEVLYTDFGVERYPLPIGS